MFSSIKEQLEVLTGPLEGNLLLTTMLTYSAWEVIMQLPERAAMIYAQEGGSSVREELLGIRFLGVRNGIKGDLRLINKYTDPASIYYATEDEPVYYFRAFGVEMIPNGYAVYVPLPFVTYTDETLQGFPNTFIRPVVLNAAIKIKTGLLREKRDQLSQLIISALAPPEASLPPEISYMDAAVLSIPVSTIAQVTSLPGYLSNLPQAPSVTVDLSLIQVPVSPSAPEIIFTEVTPPLLPEVLIEPFGTVPAYSAILPEDHTVVFESVSVPEGMPDQPDFQYINAAVSDASPGTIGPFGEAPEYIAELPDVPKFILSYPEPPVPPVAPSLTYTEAEAAKVQAGFALGLNALHGELTLLINSEEDIELAKVKIEEILSRVEEFRAQSELELSRLQENAKLQSEINLQNKVQGLQKQINEYRLRLELYQWQMQKYQADIQARTEEGKIRLGTYQANVQAKLEDGKNRFEKDLSVYQSLVQRQIEQARLIQQMVAENLHKSVSLEMQNRLEGVRSEIEKYRSSLQLYASKIEIYRADINRAVEKAALQLKTYETVSSVKLQNALNVFNASSQAYQAVVQKNIEQARLTEERLVQEYKVASDISLQNKIQGLLSQVQQYTLRLQAYSHDIESYRAKVSVKFDQARLELEKYQAEAAVKLQDALNNFQKDNAVYQAELQRAVEQARLNQERLKEEAKNSNDISLQNRARELQAETEEYTLRLQKYQAEVQQYGFELQNEADKYRAKAQALSAEIDALRSEVEMLKKEYIDQLEIVNRG